MGKINGDGCPREEKERKTEAEVIVRLDREANYQAKRHNIRLLGGDSQKLRLHIKVGKYADE